MENTMQEHHNHHNSPNTKVIFGFWIYIMTDAIMFAILLAAYNVLHTHIFGGVRLKDIANLPHTFWQTILFLIGAFIVAIGSSTIRQAKAGLTNLMLLVTLLLMAVFVIISYNDLALLVANGHTWKDSAFLSSYLSLIAIFDVHVLVVILWSIILIIQIMMQGSTAMMQTRVICLSIFVNYLSIIWFTIFALVYLIGVV